MAYQATDFSNDNEAVYTAKIDGNFACLSAAGTLPSLGLASNAGRLPRISDAGDALEYEDVSSVLGDSVSVSVAGSSTTTLTASQAGRPVLTLIGAITGDKDVVFPSNAGAWVVHNATTGDYALTLKPSGGTGVTMDRGERAVAFVISDGSTMREVTGKRDGKKPFSSSYDASLGSGYVDVVGFGYDPSLVRIKSVITNGNERSSGVSDGTVNYCEYDRSGVTAETYGYDGSNCVNIMLNVSNYMLGVVTMITDGFRITLTKTGSWNGTIYFLGDAEE